MSPLVKLLLAAGTALGVGYLIFRKPKPKPKPRPEGAPPPGVVIPVPTPEGVPPPSPPPTPEGVVPSPEAAPPKWEAIFNEGVMAKIEEGRALDSVRTGEDLQYYVASVLFPRATWPLVPRAPMWQKKVWLKIRSIMFDLAGVETWPFFATKEATESIITFWVSGRKSMEACRAQGLGPDDLRLCAARTTYPDLVWPPPSDARPWQRMAWDKFGAMPGP